MRGAYFYRPEIISLICDGRLCSTQKKYSKSLTFAYPERPGFCDASIAVSCSHCSPTMSQSESTADDGAAKQFVVESFFGDRKRKRTSAKRLRLQIEFSPSRIVRRLLDFLKQNLDQCTFTVSRRPRKVAGPEAEVVPVGAEADNSAMETDTDDSLAPGFLQVRTLNSTKSAAIFAQVPCLVYEYPDDDDEDADAYRSFRVNVVELQRVLKSLNEPRATLIISRAHGSDSVVVSASQADSASSSEFELSLLHEDTAAMGELPLVSDYSLEISQSRLKRFVDDGTAFGSQKITFTVFEVKREPDAAGKVSRDSFFSMEYQGETASKARFACHSHRTVVAGEPEVDQSQNETGLIIETSTATTSHGQWTDAAVANLSLTYRDTFAVSYISAFLAAAGSSDADVTLRFANDGPMTVYHSLGVDNSYVAFFLAPVSGDE